MPCVTFKAPCRRISHGRENSLRHVRRLRAVGFCKEGRMPFVASETACRRILHGRDNAFRRVGDCVPSVFARKGQCFVSSEALCCRILYGSDNALLCGRTNILRVRKRHASRLCGGVQTSLEHCFLRPAQEILRGAQSALNGAGAIAAKDDFCVKEQKLCAAMLTN